MQLYMACKHVEKVAKQKGFPGAGLSSVLWPKPELKHRLPNRLLSHVGHAPESHTFHLGHLADNLNVYALVLYPNSA